MACTWSSEKATKAYLHALKMGNRGKEPSEVEFLAALAAGNNSQLMVMASAGSGGTIALALLCASRQTGGRAVCICSCPEALTESKKDLGRYTDFVELVVGDAWKLLCSDYKAADFVIVDCKLCDDKEMVEFPVEQRGGVVVVGYNALRGGGRRWWRNSLGSQFLLVGEGLVVCRVTEVDDEKDSEKKNKKKKKGWVFEVDEFTGEEHFYKIQDKFLLY